jgi:hypothetical protein
MMRRLMVGAGSELRYSAGRGINFSEDFTNAILALVR